ncbi:MAG: hypothetical protein O2856_13820, partial [Planctomycetota bacterium]|nr:hypothetical protein [Planctomycetota bacterium]
LRDFLAHRIVGRTEQTHQTPEQRPPIISRTTIQAVTTRNQGLRCSGMSCGLDPAYFMRNAGLHCGSISRQQRQHNNRAAQNPLEADFRSGTPKLANFKGDFRVAANPAFWYHSVLSLSS